MTRFVQLLILMAFLLSALATIDGGLPFPPRGPNRITGALDKRQATRQDILLRQASRAATAHKRQTSATIYPTCEGSPASGSVVYAVVGSSVWSLPSQTFLTNITTQSSAYACTQTCTAYGPACIDATYDQSTKHCWLIGEPLGDRYDGIPGYSTALRGKDCAQIIAEGATGTCCFAYDG